MVYILHPVVIYGESQYMNRSCPFVKAETKKSITVVPITRYCKILDHVDGKCKKLLIMYSE
jgi:hypothetical protein